jgi:two-component sensor histidine kinase
LQKALNERELLLAEVHHRVKNNLAIISALVNLESTKIDDPKSQKIFEETRNRIYAISMVHNLLYKNPSLQEIDMVSFFSNFCSNIANGFSDGSIKIEQRIHPVNVNIDNAIPMALLLNELITNAFKHAFPNGGSGVIEVGLQGNSAGGFEFYVADNGIGMKEEDLKPSSTGMNIIHSLAEQLDATIQFQNTNGTRFTINKESLQTI